MHIGLFYFSILLCCVQPYYRLILDFMERTDCFCINFHAILGLTFPWRIHFERTNILQQSLRFATSLIITRRLPYGSRLPSAKQLCSTYQVGIRTVQDVLRDMRDAGYISLEARKRAQVIWQPSQAHDEQTDF